MAEKPEVKEEYDGMYLGLCQYDLSQLLMGSRAVYRCVCASAV